MLIANPIYDSVFKYLLEDTEAAKILIGTIIDEEILEIHTLAQEHVLELKQTDLTVYRLDFLAFIKTPEGSKEVLIEIQKAKFASDIIRFRKYLGKQYSAKPENKITLPIITIYFLGYKLETVLKPLIKVIRSYKDGYTGEEIKDKEHFIESLTHDSYIVQIPLLSQNYQTEIETLLSVFDQKLSKDDIHQLLIDESKYPLKFRSIIRRLERAFADEKIRDNMDDEDLYLEELEDKDRIIAEKDKAIEEKDKAIEEKDKALEEKDKAIEEKDKALEENKKALEDNKKAFDENKKALEDKERILETMRKELEELRKK